MGKGEMMDINWNVIVAVIVGWLMGTIPWVINGLRNK